jgi:hypothetical protein
VPANGVPLSVRILVTWNSQLDCSYDKTALRNVTKKRFRKNMTVSQNERLLGLSHYRSTVMDVSPESEALARRNHPAWDYSTTGRAHSYPIATPSLDFGLGFSRHPHPHRDCCFLEPAAFAATSGGSPSLPLLPCHSITFPVIPRRTTSPTACRAHYPCSPRTPASASSLLPSVIQYKGAHRPLPEIAIGFPPTTNKLRSFVARRRGE